MWAVGIIGGGFGLRCLGSWLLHCEAERKMNGEKHVAPGGWTPWDWSLRGGGGGRSKLQDTPSHKNPPPHLMHRSVFRMIYSVPASEA